MKNEKTSVAFLSVCAALGLVLLKAIVGITTGSLGILSEALHSALDFIAATITYISVKISDKPADREHNFGHGKVENLSAFVEAILLFITCGWIIWEALKRLVYGTVEIELGFWAFAVIIISIIVDISRSKALRNAAKKFRSQALEADALHFTTDIASSAVVLLGLICTYFGFQWADSIAALAVAVIAIWISSKLLLRAVNELLDKAPDGILEHLEEEIAKCKGVEKWHSLRVRSSGAEYIVDLNVHVKRNLNIVQAHKISEDMESRLRSMLGENAIINVHIEPDDVDNETPHK